MRKVSYALASSLDNFIARPDGSVDWLFMKGEHMKDFAVYAKSFDTVLMGRKTYEFALRHGITAYPGMRNYVFSRTMKESPDQRVTIISEEAGEFVRKLKSEEGKDIWLNSGPGLARTLFEEDLIDQIVVNVHPLLLGSGVPLFPELSQQINLELLDHRVYPLGLVLLTYRVRRKLIT